MSSETSRVEAFSDGVFAIAITLLILDVHVPTSAQGSLGHALARQWPTYVAFLISFAFIGIMWVNHHRLFNHIRRTDNGLMFLNLLLLLGVTIVPFPTALIAAHYYTGGRTIAAAVFNGTYVVIAIFFNVLWHHAVRSDLLDASTRESAEAISKQYAVGPVSYLICFGLTWVSVPASLAVNIALAMFFAVPPRTHIDNPESKKRPQMHIATK
jgi:TMEM175 potassium channel family protein